MRHIAVTFALVLTCAQVFSFVVACPDDAAVNPRFEAINGSDVVCTYVPPDSFPQYVESGYAVNLESPKYEISFPALNHYKFQYALSLKLGLANGESGYEVKILQKGQVLGSGSGNISAGKLVDVVFEGDGVQPDGGVLYDSNTPGDVNVEISMADAASFHLSLLASRVSICPSSTNFYLNDKDECVWASMFAQEDADSPILLPFFVGEELNNHENFTLRVEVASPLDSSTPIPFEAKLTIYDLNDIDRVLTATGMTSDSFTAVEFNDQTVVTSNDNFFAVSITSANSSVESMRARLVATKTNTNLMSNSNSSNSNNASELNLGSSNSGNTSDNATLTSNTNSNNSVLSVGGSDQEANTSSAEVVTCGSEFNASAGCPCGAYVWRYPTCLLGVKQDNGLKFADGILEEKTYTNNLDIDFNRAFVHLTLNPMDGFNSFDYDITVKVGSETYTLASTTDRTSRVMVRFPQVPGGVFQIPAGAEYSIKARITNVKEALLQVKLNPE